jgi:hypothetical protein
MSIFNLNEVIFSNSVQTQQNSNQSRFDLSVHRYPEDVGSAKYGHYMIFEIFVRENINQDFNVSTRGGDPVDYIIRKALSKTRGGGSVSAALNTIADSSLVSQVTGSAQSAASNLGINSQISNINNLFGGTNSDIASRADTELTSINELFGGSNSAYATRSRTRASSLANRAAQQIKNDLSNSFNNLKRATESIVLYMPDTLNFDYTHSYKDLSLSENPLMAATQAAAAAASMSKGNVRGLSPFLVETLSKITNNAGGTNELGQAALGFAINPQFEVVYQATGLREFQFDFMFYPRDETEAGSVQNIINAFKFHAAPEVISGGGGRYLLAPSAFDISFFYNGKRNVNIPRISTCVCTSINLDYAPNGWAAYEVQGEPTPRLGRTGTPVATRLQLRFKEMTMITKELLRGGLGSTLDEGNLDTRGSTF